MSMPSSAMTKHEQAMQEFSTIANQIIKKHLENKDFSEKEAKTFSNSISDELIKVLSAAHRGYKYICNCTIFAKGEPSLSFSSTCLWDENSDASMTTCFESENMHCFVCLYGIAP